MEEQRRQSREAAKEKLVAVARAKDQIREQSNSELENVKDKLKQVSGSVKTILLYVHRSEVAY